PTRRPPDPPTPPIHALSLHDALPICPHCPRQGAGRTATPTAPTPPPRHQTPPPAPAQETTACSSPLAGRRPAGLPDPEAGGSPTDRKSTRLNSSHVTISYAVFCLKEK